jgi:hypothetical protein
LSFLDINGRKEHLGQKGICGKSEADLLAWLLKGFMAQGKQ